MVNLPSINHSDKPSQQEYNIGLMDTFLTSTTLFSILSPLEKAQVNHRTKELVRAYDQGCLPDYLLNLATVVATNDSAQSLRIQTLITEVQAKEDQRKKREEATIDNDFFLYLALKIENFS